MRKKKRKLSKAELLNRQIENWERKQEGAVIMLRKSAEMLLALRRKRRRMLDRETVVLRAKSVAPPVVTPTVEDDEDIPAWLNRVADSGDKDAVARAEIEAEQAAQKKVKAERAAEKRQIKKETIVAELTGKRRKMPLSGRDALKAIAR